MALPFLTWAGRILAKYAPDIGIAAAAVFAEKVLDTAGTGGTAEKYARKLDELEYPGHVGQASAELAQALGRLDELEGADEDNLEEELLARLDELDELVPPDQIVEVRHSNAPPSRC